MDACFRYLQYGLFNIESNIYKKILVIILSKMSIISNLLLCRYRKKTNITASFGKILGLLPQPEVTEG